MTGACVLRTNSTRRTPELSSRRYRQCCPGGSAEPRRSAPRGAPQLRSREAGTFVSAFATLSLHKGRIRNRPAIFTPPEAPPPSLGAGPPRRGGTAPLPSLPVARRECRGPVPRRRCLVHGPPPRQDWQRSRPAEENRRTPRPTRQRRVARTSSFSFSDEVAPDKSGPFWSDLLARLLPWRS